MKQHNNNGSSNKDSSQLQQLQQYVYRVSEMTKTVLLLCVVQLHCCMSNRNATDRLQSRYRTSHTRHEITTISRRRATNAANQHSSSW